MKIISFTNHVMSNGGHRLFYLLVNFSQRGNQFFSSAAPWSLLFILFSARGTKALPHAQNESEWDGHGTTCDLLKTWV